MDCSWWSQLLSLLGTSSQIDAQCRPACGLYQVWLYMTQIFKTYILQHTSVSFIISAEFVGFALPKGEHLSYTCGFLSPPVPRFDGGSLGIDDQTLQVPHCLCKCRLLVVLLLLSSTILCTNDPTAWLIT